jgi:hypothetical protein
MGLLSLGTPLKWEESRAHAAHVRRHGIAQLLAVVRRLAGRMHDALLWGDEVEPLPSDRLPIPRSLQDPTQRTRSRRLGPTRNGPQRKPHSRLSHFRPSLSRLPPTSTLTSIAL